MPWRDPDPTDPQVLVGVAVPADPGAVREMAATFADELVRMGFERGRILLLFRNPFYAGVHAALTTLGEAEVERLVDESFERWGRCRYVVEDCAPEAVGPLDAEDACEAAQDGRRPLVGPGGLLKMVR